ncbi:hypothetical protein GP2_033_00700 [Gordonia paraffinivorans NBRC 108238]|uniref:Apea-like HEPN domain-containing protein n=1 Tax=Gordonia paraffinivorans NBRC 108238 TaxID=1223543 RepID=A0ABQ0IP71_9ACTN|nr:hypothetical protein [Gordonia paraffinivorans]GAC85335.1 hypothetical protein GP2_033_00700 [Gordonia paraffinivorans NBRC 108238]
MIERDGDDVTIHLGSPASSVISMVGTASVGVRGYRSTQHLWSAKRAARECSEIEDRIAGTNAADIALESCATNAVMLSVAFMEAAVNEVLQDLAEAEPGRVSHRCKGIEPEAAPLIRALWVTPARLERAGILEKYQVALTATRKPEFDTSTNPYQSAVKLIALRNALVHFKPEWQMDDDEHKMFKMLKGLFPESRVFPNPVSPWYPHVCLASGCAEWAHKTATAFVDEWWVRMGIERDYRVDLGGFPPP